MRPFSKKAEEGQGLCNYCGKWKPTDLTPEQLEGIDWKCADCATQRGQVPDEQRSIERGQKEISKYDPEYQFLVKLVKLVVKEGIPAEEIRSLANAYPFETVDDVGDLTAKVWTLATQKYKIPSEWLQQRLPKNASKKVADLWPAQEEAEDMINHAPGYIAYEYGQDKESKPKGLNLDMIVKILNESDVKVTHIDTAANTIQLTDGSVLSFEDAAKRAM